MKKLTDFERWVIEDKGTEPPGSGLYENTSVEGQYFCKKCDALLYDSTMKFHSGCGWPAFDDAVPGSVSRLPDADGKRTEIVCAKCAAHLGHVFEGERFTAKNTRHCVNSTSMVFRPKVLPEYRTAYVASGCFWGTEYYFARLPGVVATTTGYSGGAREQPTYEQVCAGATGHLETIEILYDPRKVSYRRILEFFFETHDFTQKDGQGPDVGPQYLSGIFVQSDDERKEAEKIIEELKGKGYAVATSVREFEKFWSAEGYHQDYYETVGKQPYCHSYRKIF